MVWANFPNTFYFNLNIKHLEDFDLILKRGVTLSKVDIILHNVDMDLGKNVSQKVCFHQGSLPV